VQRWSGQRRNQRFRRFRFCVIASALNRQAGFLGAAEPESP
jgi:hypothetical protein